jgi:hypothetical protein
MAAQPSPEPAPATRVPAHAWTWLQRSRSVLAEIAGQLYGTVAEPHVLDRLRADHAADPFVQDLVARVVCDVAFNGRVPERRPAGARWDRGLTWWAAHLAGVTPQEFEARSAGTAPPQPALFGPPPAPPPPPTPATPARRRPLVSVERRAMVQALRDVLAAGDGSTVPADAVRALIAQLERSDDEPPT